MARPKKNKIRFTRPLEAPRPGREVRIEGSTIIARFTNCMLKKPKPATPISDAR